MELVLAEILPQLSDTQALVRALLRLLAAVLCGAVIGLQRERWRKPAGLRTHILVAAGSALLVVVASKANMATADISRVIQGVATGIGFLGAGAILKRETGILGLTTAAGIWITSAIGVAAGMGQYGTALMATVLAWLILSVLGRIEQQSEENRPPPPR